MSFISYSTSFPTERPNSRAKEIKVAFLGNPNCGKTTLFNALTGSNQYVGNWSGVTVEKYEGFVKHSNLNFSIVDLPGTYSLSAVSPDEKVTADFISSHSADVIVNVIAASALERSLFLTLQTLKAGVPMIAALTFMDELEKHDATLNIKALSDSLGIEIIPIYYNGENPQTALLSAIGNASLPKNLHSSLPPYKLIGQIVSRALYRGSAYTPRKYSVDRMLAGGILSVPIFIMIMLMIFAVTFGPIGTYLSEATSFLICNLLASAVKNLLQIINTAPLLVSLVTDGIIPGVGSVISFLPQLALFFFFVSLLEGSGYMARTAFIADSFLEKLGLSGKSVIPMIMGFGCTVPAIMSTRTIDSEKQRRMTILLLPFMSCSAKLPVILMLSSAFFEKYAAFVVMCMYLLGIISAVTSAFIFKSTIFKRQNTPFILELPPYRTPSLKSTALQVHVRIRSFLSKVGTTLFMLSMALWFLQNFDSSLHICTSPENSLLYVLGSSIAPIFVPLGFGAWQAAVALIAGLAAKEAILSTLAVLYSFSLSASPVAISAELSCFTPLSALSFLVFTVLYVPCIAAVSTMNKELHSVKWTAFSVLWQIIFAYSASFAVYGIGRVFGF